MVFRAPQWGAEQKTKANAVTAWAERWHQSPRTSLAYQTALTEPPDGRPHPTFLAPAAAQAPDRTPERHTRATQGPGHPRAKKAKFAHKTYSTLYRMITGHAFTGAYTAR